MNNIIRRCVISSNTKDTESLLISSKMRQTFSLNLEAVMAFSAFLHTKKIALIRTYTHYEVVLGISLTLTLVMYIFYMRKNGKDNSI